MADRTESSAPPAQSLFGVMPDVVKGLRKQPALLFGIGASIVLVAVLAATTSVWLVLIVAAVLVLALGAWLVNEAGVRRRRAVENVVSAKRARIGKRAKVGTVDEVPGGVSQDVNVEGAQIGEGSSVGTVGSGSSGAQQPRG
jgi:HAMP domain-containing protein